MKTEELYEALLDKGYNQLQAKRLSKNLSELGSKLSECLESWIKTGVEKDFSSHGISIKGLMSKYKLRYPAALLSLDWVVKDPETAIKAINKGIK